MHNVDVTLIASRLYYKITIITCNFNLHKGVILMNNRLSLKDICTKLRGVLLINTRLLY
jgi:hypothetical protein